MALTERTEVSRREVLADGQIQVRTDTVIERDGVEISRRFHRHVVVPGADLSGEDESVQTVANAVHTAEVIAAYKAARE
ncbi:hypothetical protein [uncultured Mediterranean phage uvDeep-CGR2-KM23-C198]|nr:hypothetical protein [uncultured Mediterranean phage uvDeep-CGR2-KM23-C198]